MAEAADARLAAATRGPGRAARSAVTVHHPRVTTETAGESGVDLRVATTPRTSRLRPFPFHPLLLAAYPVLFLFSENLSEVAFGETFQPILRAVAVAGAIALVAGLLLRDLRRGALIASADGHRLVHVRPRRGPGRRRWASRVTCSWACRWRSSWPWPWAPSSCDRRRIARLTSAVNIVSVVLVV